MKFRCIQEFIDLVPDCQHCGYELVTTIKSKNTPVTASKFNMTFDKIIFADPFELELKRAFSEKPPAITYTSFCAEDQIHFCYQLQETVHHIFSVHKSTNAIIGQRDKVQKVFWDHNPVIRRQCYNPSCIESKTNYFCDSTPLVLERISNTLYPFFLSTEVLTILYRDDIYGLMSIHHEMNSTYLMAHHNMIKELPIIPLYKIRGGDTIYNKIKTLVNFS